MSLHRPAAASMIHRESGCKAGRGLIRRICAASPTSKRKEGRVGATVTTEGLSAGIAVFHLFRGSMDCEAIREKPLAQSEFGLVAMVELLYQKSHQVGAAEIYPPATFHDLRPQLRKSAPELRRRC